MSALTRCSAQGCLSIVRQDRRWCSSHRPTMEAPPRSVVHRIARLLMAEPGLTTEAVVERLDCHRQEVVIARRLTGIQAPQPLPWMEIHDTLDRCLVAARSRAMATVRHVDPAEVA